MASCPLFIGKRSALPRVSLDDMTVLLMPAQKPLLAEKAKKRHYEEFIWMAANGSEPEDSSSYLAIG